MLAWGIYMWCFMSIILMYTHKIALVVVEQPIALPFELCAFGFKVYNLSLTHYNTSCTDACFIADWACAVYMHDE